MLLGFGLSGFRSFGPEPQFIAPLAKINIFAGQNNAGKSNILRALSHLEAFLLGRAGDAPTLDPNLDIHRGTREAAPRWHLPYRTDAESVETLVRLRVREIRQPDHLPLVQKFLEPLMGHAGLAWFEYNANSPHREIVTPTVDELIAKAKAAAASGGVTASEWARIWGMLKPSYSGGDMEQSWIPESLQLLGAYTGHKISKVHNIDAHRQIGRPESQYQGLNGEGLIARLRELQNPEFARRDERAKFDKINGFLSSVTGIQGARLDVSHSGRELLADIGGKLLPIQSLGTGIQEVVIFAAAATAIERSVLCIEEPEIHLHPRLQKQLLRYLQRETNNQYFITTHSAHLLDSPDVALFHVQLNEHQESKVTPILSPSQRAHACFDLGYRPSDLVQSNAIIWVEGPSDRIYLNAWIAALDASLVEGLHYSIMFYGGRLLSHLGAEDVEVSEFIQLQRLNRNVAILIDSDMASADAPLNSTKRRVASEVEEQGGFTWVTAGREVENYVATDVRDRALSAIHPHNSYRSPRDQFSCCYVERASGKAALDKVKFAKEAVRDVRWDVLDLEVKCRALVDFIRCANH